MFSNGNSYNGSSNYGNNGGSCSIGLGILDPFEPGICRFLSSDTRHLALR